MDLPTPEDLKEKRKELGLTQSELAKRADVSQPLIARVENGDVDPRLSTVSRIIDVLEHAEEEKVTAGDIMSDEIVSVRPDDSVKEAVDTMHEAQFSQLPVINRDGVPLGSVSDSLVARLSSEIEDLPDKAVNEIMEDAFPTVGPDADMNTLSHLLDHSSAVLATKEGKVIGIITDADIAAQVGTG